MDPAPVSAIGKKEKRYKDNGEGRDCHLYTEGLAEGLENTGEQGVLFSMVGESKGKALGEFREHPGGHEIKRRRSCGGLGGDRS